MPLSPVSQTPAAPVRVALLGAGTVGAAVARRLVDRADLLAARVGAPLELTGIAVRDLARPRDLTGVPAGLLTDDPQSLVTEADVVVEVMGGIQPARGLIETALTSGADVVTANKQLLAQHGVALEALAATHGRALAYEAAVVAAVPVMRTVLESLAGDEIRSIRGIVNGSTNYVLDTVARQGVAFQDAVQQAGELGYLEADPTEDLEGLDAAAKIVLLARAAWGVEVGLEDVRCKGISGLTDADFENARGTGQVIKLIASAQRFAGSGAAGSGTADAPRVQVSVQPTPVAADHPFALARGGTNMVIIEAESAGPLHLSGAGAGGDETGSAVLGDIVDVARARVRARS